MLDRDTIPPAVTDLARRVLAYEAHEQPEAEALSLATERVFVKLRWSLVDLIGPNGFSGLFSRALHVAQGEFPVLAAISFDPAAPETLLGTREPALATAATAGETSPLTMLMAHFVWLLMTFIGEQISMQLLKQIWPDVFRHEAASGGAES